VLATRADTIAQTAERILGNVEEQLVDSGGMRELRLMLQSINRTAATLARTVDAQSRQLELTLASLRSRTQAIDSARVDSAVRSIQAATANFESTSAELRATSIELKDLVAKIDTGNGTLAKLLNDDQLFVNLVGLTAGADSLFADMKRNPRKYINLSIFGRR
jgi:phospholipid/cholesterol/gamma-HCH transport system substrate-binding protein